MRWHGWALTAGLGLMFGCGDCGGEDGGPFPNNEELSTLQGLRFVKSAVTVDRTNALFDLPDRSHAVRLGDALFHEKALSSCGQVACADCHKFPSYADPGKAVSTGCDGQEGTRNAPTLLNVRYHRFFFWDGRADSLWAQATGPLTDPKEMGATPARVRDTLQTLHAADYQAVFGKSPSETVDDGELLTNVGKAIQLYLFEDKFIAGASPFDDAFRDFLGKAEAAVAADNGGRGDADRLQEELEGHPLFRGIETFFRKGQCVLCHSGPLFADESFHNIGLAQVPGRAEWDHGVKAGYPRLRDNPFNGGGAFSADRTGGGARLQGLRELAEGPDGEGAFKTPSLRNLGATGPYMHDGSMATLEEVIDFYDRGGDVVGSYPGRLSVSLKPLGLDDEEKRALLELLQQLTDPSLTE